MSFPVAWTDNGDGTVDFTEGEAVETMATAWFLPGEVLVMDFVNNVEDDSGPGFLVGVPRQSISAADIAGDYTFFDPIYDDYGYAKADDAGSIAYTVYDGDETYSASGSMVLDSPWAGWVQMEGDESGVQLFAPGFGFFGVDREDGSYVTLGVRNK